MNSIKCGLFQLDIAWEDKTKNKIKIGEILEKYLQNNKIDWLIFPEFSLTGFSLDRIKAELNEHDKSFFKELSVKFGLNISYGALYGGYNKIITIDKSGTEISDYSKIHLFSFGNEHRHYNPGNEQDRFELNGIRIIPAVCYDLRFSYLFWNNALNNDVFVVIANWPAGRRNHWITLLKARAIENQCYVIGVNRTGADPNLQYSGDSMIIDPFGNEVLNCGNNEGIFSAEINKNAVVETREKFQFLKDRKNKLD